MAEILYDAWNAKRRCHARVGPGHKFEKPGDDPAFRVASRSSFS
jgi:hypothetical protein